jgi:hypothetical protein
MSDAQIVSLMETRGISPAQVSQTFGLPEGQIVSRVAATVPPNQSVLLGDTWIQPQYSTTGSGETQETGPIESILSYKTSGDVNSQIPEGTKINNYKPTGELAGTSVAGPSSGPSFFGGLKDAFKDPFVRAALLGVAGGAGVFDGLLSGVGAGSAAGAEGLTLSELGLNANNLANATNVADIVAGAEGGGLLTKTAADAAAFELQNAGASALTDLTATQGGLLTKTAAQLAAEKLAADAAAKTVVTKTAAEIAADKLASDTALKLAVGAGTNLLTKTGADAVSGLLQTTGSLVQSKESKDAALKAATDIAKASQTAQEAAQFRPVGMTTRFGTSNYTYDPVTGRMTSAGYQLSPEAKAAQDQFVKLAESGITQAKQAQQQFAPLQTGAQNLFGLGNQYISQSPQDVAQNYINQQMQLLQPSREMELANLQNRLQQQGRAGLSVAQGGTLGATTPELQALYNARAQQELQLASQAQQAGQQNVLFGAGLLGQGATAMGNYYGGQQAAYAPYTTALGQVQNLETQAQQPLAMGASLAQQASTAGARAGQLGLTGQQLSSAYSTGANATYNPYAGLLTAAGNPNAMFGQVVSSALSPGGVVDRYLYPSGNPLQTGIYSDPGYWT